MWLRAQEKAWAMGGQHIEEAAGFIRGRKPVVAGRHKVHPHFADRG